MAKPTKYGNSRYWKEWTYNTGDAGGVQTLFPLVMGSYGYGSTFFSNCATEGLTDVVFTTEAGALVPVERVLATRAGEDFIFWFRMPSVSNIVGQKIYLQYGGPTVNVASSTDVWANGYGGSKSHVLTMHFQNNLSDSTVNNSTVTAYNSPGYADGLLGRCLTLNGTNQYLQISDANAFSFTNGSNDLPFTVRSRARAVSSGSNVHYLIEKVNTSFAEWSYLVYSEASTADSQIAVYDNVGSVYRVRRRQTGGVIDIDASYAGTYNGDKTNPLAGLKTYVNSVRVDNQTLTAGTYGGMHNTTSDVYIGARPSLGGANFFKGNLCELMLIGGELSQNDLITHHNNESKFSTNGSFTESDSGSFGGAFVYFDTGLPLSCI